MSFLPITASEMKILGWDQPDFVLITGDGYVDHPSFGTAIIGRLLSSKGYRVAILPQPDWRSTADFTRFGRPRLGFLVNSGNVDSMVNHFSVFQNRRKVDKYAPGGKAGYRPDRAVIVYANKIREAYRDAPIIIGGVEASLRRFAHYDYWSDKVRRSILLDAKADILIYGMGERAVVEIARLLDRGVPIGKIKKIRGTCTRVDRLTEENIVEMPSFNEVSEDRKKYCESFVHQYRNQDSLNALPLAEAYGENSWVLQNPPQPPLSEDELDAIYELDYQGTYHPYYEKLGGIPGIEEVQFSIVSSRGCFGGCSFCALTYHQGRQVRGRSKDSIVAEAKRLTERADFKGYIHDVGGPTANFRKPACRKQIESGTCKDRDCLFPTICKNMEVDHRDYLEILDAVRKIEGIKKVFIRSGIRYDYLMADEDDSFFEAMCKYHVSGILKVAPEHVSDRVLEHMKKTRVEVFEAFEKKYKDINERLGKKQYLIPYLISSHPGSTISDAIDLAVYLKRNGFVPDQVQDFYPTPGTLATTMYYTEMNPFTLEKVWVAKKTLDKRKQRALIHYNKPENRNIVLSTLKEAGREDLIEYLLGKKDRTGRGGIKEKKHGHRKRFGKNNS